MNLDQITQQYLQLFPTDFSENLQQRQTTGFVCAITPIFGFKEAKLLHFNKTLSESIGLGLIEHQKDLDFINATAHPENFKTYSTAYAGHQFGTWAGQLGDGRAIFAGEIKNNIGETTEIQWKGAGATPFSRHADGRAVLRSTIREYLMSEAMHHLKIPTTRALSISFSGENVARDIMYNGNVDFEKGAVMIRTAESFLRFGHFELLAARNEIDSLQKLADFSIANYYPEINSSGNQKYLDFYQEILEKTADLVVDWYRVGFVHGVMNTDNMSILGLTIDYGPFSFIDQYSLNFTPNTTDLPGRRYAFGKQAQIAQWNLIQLANALFPLINNQEVLGEKVNLFSEYFWKKHDEMMATKFGFDEVKTHDPKFFSDFQNLMQENAIDYTLFFQKLENYDNQAVLEHFNEVFYEELSENQQSNFIAFIENYKERLLQNTISKEDSLALMQKSNPKFILRNYLLYQCIKEMESGKTTLFEELWEALQNPYQETNPKFSKKRPKEFDEIVGCTSLSCSS